MRRRGLREATGRQLLREESATRFEQDSMSTAWVGGVLARSLAASWWILASQRYDSNVAVTPCERFWFLQGDRFGED